MSEINIYFDVSMVSHFKKTWNFYLLHTKKMSLLGKVDKMQEAKEKSLMK